MKRIIIMAATILATLSYIIPSHAATLPHTNSGPALRELWNKYEKTRAKDLPKQQKALLETIMQEALTQKLPLDYYLASNQYVYALPSYIHDTSKPSEKVLTQGLGKFGPLVDYLLKTGPGGQNYDLDYIISHKTELTQQQNPLFYRNISNPNIGALELPQFVSKYISNDYECILWYTYTIVNSYSHYSYHRTKPSNPTSATIQILNLLSEELGTTYPNGTYAQLRKICDMSHRQGIMDFIQSQSRNALSLYATYELLNSQKDSLLNWRNAPKDKEQKRHASSQLKNLLQDCKAAIGKREAFRGKEKLIASACPAFEQISSEILQKTVMLRQKSSEIELITRNLPYVDVKLMRDSLHGPLVHQQRVDNLEQSCYYLDTLRLKLPSMDDGDYVMTVKSTDFSQTFRIYMSRLSVASVRTEKGYAFYLCDAFSGKPVEEADVTILSGKDTLAKLSDYRFEGWTFLNAPFEELISSDEKSATKSHEWLRVHFQTKDIQGFTKECEQSLNHYSPAYNKDKSTQKGKIVTDRAAYHPGDTIQFKVICWQEGDNVPHLASTYKAGTKVTVALYDSENQILSTKALTLNEFGSDAGAFVLPEKARNGHFRIQLAEEQNWLDAVYVTVDNFVLPDFDIIFSEDRSLKFVGDTLTIKGIVKTYTGHPLSQARAEYTLSLGEDISKGHLDLTQDGSFELALDTKRYNSQDYLQYAVNVRVTDGNGKTQERSTYRFLAQTFSFDAEFLDEANGRVEVSQTRLDEEYRQCKLTDKDTVRFVVGANLQGQQDVRIYSKLRQNGKLISNQEVAPGDTLSLILLDSGLYDVDIEVITFDGMGRERRAVQKYTILRVQNTDDAVDPGVDRFFRKVATDSVSIQFGISDGPVWAVFYVSDGYNMLNTSVIHVDSPRGVTLVSVPWQESWPQTVTVGLLYFRDGQAHHYSESFQRTNSTSNKMPLLLHLLRDKVYPRQVCSLTINGLPHSECVVSVFDKRTEALQTNYWTYDQIRHYDVYLRLNIQVPSNFTNTYKSYPLYDYGDRRNSSLLTKADCVEQCVEVESVMSESDFKVRGVDTGQVLVRENFASTLCFEPFARTDDDGKASLSFEAAYELSTFVVSVYAHNQLMYNNVVREELVVSVPVQVSLNVPQYLYSSDKYAMAVSVTNDSENAVKGQLICEVYDCKDYKYADPIAVMSKPITVCANDGVTHSFPMDISDMHGDSLYFKLSFSADTFSDAVLVEVPVLKPEQTLTESHTLVQPASMSDDEAYERLAGEFIRTSPYGATFSVKSVRDIVSDFYFNLSPSQSFDALSCSNDIFNMLIASDLKIMGFDGINITKYDETVQRSVQRLLKCFNPDGGVAWVPGMKSNVFVTNHILGLMCRLADYGLWKGYIADSELGHCLDRALHFLDKEYSKDWSRNYLFYRCSIGFISPWTGRPLQNLKFARKLRKEIVSNLTDFSSVRADVSAKLSTIPLIFKLLEDNGKFIKDCGFTDADCKRLKKSAAMNIFSLIDYAVESSYGALYFPSIKYSGRYVPEETMYTYAIYIFNKAIQLYESDKTFMRQCDKYNHLNVSALSGFKRARDGLYLWILMQKESQYWKNNPYYFDAIYTLLSAPEHIQNIKVAILSKTYTKPFSDIAETALEGMKISVKYSRYDELSKLFIELRPEESLRVGEKIVAHYIVESENDRSLVKLAAARPACLRPLNQLSGWYYSARNYINSCYREVKSDKTIYWLDTLPKGQMEFTEELIVTQEGTFSSAASEVTCDYAPNYRANTAAPTPMTIN